MNKCDALSKCVAFVIPESGENEFGAKINYLNHRFHRGAFQFGGNLSTGALAE